jgi:hypothetical protein
MSSPYTRLRTEEEELMYDAGLMDGRDKERERIIKLLEDESRGKDEEVKWALLGAITMIKEKSNG